MQDSTAPPTGHDIGGTYGQEDVSLAAERSRFRTTQNYRSTAAQVDEPKIEGEQSSTEPGSQLDSGAS